MRRRISGSWPAARSSSQRSAVRRSCQTIARCRRCAGAPVPDHDRLALVRDADRGDGLAHRLELARDLAERLERDAPDVLGVVLDPARLREVLRELAVRTTRAACRARPTAKAADAGGARVDRDHAWAWTLLRRSVASFGAVATALDERGGERSGPTSSRPKLETQRTPALTAPAQVRTVRHGCSPSGVTSKPREHLAEHAPPRPAGEEAGRAQQEPVIGQHDEVEVAGREEPVPPAVARHPRSCDRRRSGPRTAGSRPAQLPQAPATGACHPTDGSAGGSGPDRSQPPLRDPIVHGSRGSARPRHQSDTDSAAQDRTQSSRGGSHAHRHA